MENEGYSIEERECIRCGRIIPANNVWCLCETGVDNVPVAEPPHGDCKCGGKNQEKMKEPREKESFTKHDSDKLHWSKFAWGGAAWVMRIMEFGAAKYSWDNWRKESKGKDQRWLDAAQRHMTAHFRGVTIDPESGKPTIAHAACCLLFYLEDVKEPKELPKGEPEIFDPEGRFQI